jgi:hypothetical protein
MIAISTKVTATMRNEKSLFTQTNGRYRIIFHAPNKVKESYHKEGFFFLGILLINEQSTGIEVLLS